ncbi:MAG: Coenzyme F420 hydrogenase/dehydrogenase, beta subunit C-terminal domain [Deltaproteobacteria bacterium]|nr:Coenzyme F420 hydrogenase/dehydrogenase, beta subunit C-terminal domain [Deltaproteobacteria bacterium]
MNRGLKGLEERVLSQNLCISCGACLSLCPYLRSWQGRVVKLHDCGLDEGRCFAYCPRIDVDQGSLQGKAHGKDDRDVVMGPVRAILMARAKDPIWRQRAQSGGVVSALIDFALRKKAIDAAILTLRDTDLLPKGRMVRNREDILTCAGSSYVSGPTLEALHKGPWQEEEKIGVVGLPCQALALAKMGTTPVEKKGSIDKVNLVIGLFCTWALEYEKLMVFLKKRVGEGCIEKMDITSPPERLFKIKMADGLHSLPVDEIRPFIRNGCRVCFDMTAEFSDISVGTVEGIEGWSTVILRSDTGEDLFKKAEGEGIIESRPLPEDHLNHLREASLLKKERAFIAIKERKKQQIILQKP